MQLNSEHMQPFVLMHTLCCMCISSVTELHRLKISTNMAVCILLASGGR
jgi:hypothetical protein